jgi:DNA-binding NarL/FixJ family response regulator
MTSDRRPPVRVLIVDDHAVVRAGLRLLLEAERDIEVVGEAGDAREALDATRSLQPHLVLMDLILPGTNGIEATRALLHERPALKILVLSMQDDAGYVREAFAAGALGYVLKEAADTEVVGAVRQVAAGERHLDPALGARLATAEAAEQEHIERDPLSEREREVLTLLALGHTNQEIAQMLHISVRTAETHRAHVMRKLRISTRAELVRYALSAGLLNGAHASVA